MNCKADSVVGGTDTKHGFVGQLRTKCKTGLRRRMCRRTASGLATNCINYAVFLEENKRLSGLRVSFWRSGCPAERHFRLFWSVFCRSFAVCLSMLRSFLLHYLLSLQAPGAHFATQLAVEDRLSATRCC